MATTYRLETSNPTSIVEGTYSDNTAEGFHFKIVRTGTLDSATVLFTIGPSASGPAADDTDFRGTGTFSQNQIEFAAGQSESMVHGVFLSATLSRKTTRNSSSLWIPSMATLHP